MKSLSDLAVGERAVVSALHGQGGVGARLLEMGLIPGTSVELIGRAPLGDPLEFRLRGFLLSLRKSEAALVEIR
ncbi:MAG: FeoA family protein [Pirellulales bacterium]